MEKVNIELYRGQTYQRNIVISNFKGTITKMYFTVKEDTDSKTVVLQKKINDGIKLMDVDKEGNLIYLLNLLPKDTENLKTDFNYGYDITVIADGDNYIKEPIVMGNFRVLPVYTTRREET